MKIRNGFVSNSSSSSFLIACKGNLEEEMLKLSIPDGFWKSITEDFLKGFVKLAKHDQVFYTRQHALDFYKNEYKSYTNEEIIQEHKKIFEFLDEGYVVYFGSAESNAPFPEGLISEIDINYSSDNLIIKHDGGY